MIAMRNAAEDPTSGSVLLLARQPKRASLWQSLLEEKGCTVFCEPVIAGALDFLQGFSPSLVVVGLQLPPEQHLELCRRLRAAYNGPLLFLVGAASSQALLDLYQAGADECLLDPEQTVFLPVKAIAWMQRLRWVQPGSLPVKAEQPA